MTSRPILVFLLALASLASATAAGAAVIQADSIYVSVPSGSNDTTSPYTDDVLLDRIVIGTADYATQNSFRTVSRLQVLTNRGNTNAEWGDNDNASDGDDNPFVKAGYGGASQETTDPTIQDATMLNAFNSLSLSEMSDGEGGGFSFRVMFSAGLQDNDNAVDSVPEIMLFERGMNDIFDVRLITGGSFAAPTYSSTLTVNSSQFWNTGISVDTVEIGSSQVVGFGGFDLNDFGISGGETVFGLEILASGGPDLNAILLASPDPNNFVPLTPVPVPAGLPLLATALVATGIAGHRRRRRAA